MEPVPQHCTNVSMGVPGEDLRCLQFLKSSEQKVKEQNSMTKKAFTEWEREKLHKKIKASLIQGTPGEQSPQAQNLQNKYLEFLNLMES